MSRLLFLLFFGLINSFIHAQANNPDPLKDIDPASSSSTPGSEIGRQVLPRTEIPGTIRQTQEDENPSPIMTDPTLSRHNASDTVFISLPGAGITSDAYDVPMDSIHLEPNYQQGKSVDTLDYLPILRKGTVSPDSARVLKP